MNTIPLSSADRDRVREAVMTVADRLADPDRSARIAGADDNRDPIYDAVMWSPVTLSNGWPGSAVFFGALTRDETTEAGQWRALAHAQLDRAAAMVSATPHRGLFAGPGALLAAVQAIALGTPHYVSMRGKLAGWVADLVREQLEEERRHEKPGVSWASYDLINGVGGSARLLLDSVDDEAESDVRVREALVGALSHLVRVSEPTVAHGQRVPGWWVPSHAQVSDRDRADYPEGDFNLGLAHGVPGPMAVLSHALRRGHEVPGQRAAIRRMATWLLGWTLTDEAGPYWPCRVSLAEEVASRRMEHTGFTRTAWCYGAPGVAVALHAAGTALGEPDWVSTATAALRAALARQEDKWSVDGPTICHGYAGLLAICARVGADTGDSELLRGAARLTRSLLDFADGDTPFLFAHHMRYARGDAPSGSGHKTLAVAGLLEGAAGVAAVLHSVGRDARSTGEQSGGEWAWQRCVGLR